MISARAYRVRDEEREPAAQVHGVGLPPLKELTEFLYAQQVRISV